LRQRRKIRSTTNDEGSEWPQMQGKQIEEGACPTLPHLCSFLLPVLGPTPPAEDSDPINSEGAAQASAAGSCGVHTTPGHQGKASRRPVSCASQRHLESSQVRIGATNISTPPGPSAGGGCNCVCLGDHADGAGPWNSSAASEVHDLMILALEALSHRISRIDP
jgi:hypothetical protein